MQKVCKHAWSVAGAVMGSRQIVQLSYAGEDMAFWRNVESVWSLLWDGRARYPYTNTPTFVFLWKVILELY
jgi:hypothetical protein